MKQTPQLHAKGFYKFASPWTVKAGTIYECLAIRTFTDIYKLGQDVYRTYYEPVGLIEGVVVPGTSVPFTFSTEVAQEPNIITLRGSDGSMIYIPDTFILKVPDSTLVPYSQVVLGVSLGPLPDDVNIDIVKQDIAALVASRMGINANVKVCRAGLESNPTFDEHVLLERARLEGAPAVTPTTQAELDTARAQLLENEIRIQVLSDALIEAGLTESE